MKHIFFLFTLFSLCFAPTLRAQETPEVQIMGKHDQFVMAMVEDRQGLVWVGTEDQGVWKLNLEAPGRPRWTQYTKPQGLSDDRIYALACDQQNRIWAGHLNGGVSVFDGQKWRAYPLGDGPIGERVFDIAVCPTDGDVWIATNAGLTRYSIRNDDWTHFTRDDGLPENAVNALAFNARGDLFIGSESHGLAIARAEDQYQNWRTIAGPSRLPSDLINDVLITRDNRLYVATPAGLARSDDEGQTWRVLRRRDADAKTTEHLHYLPTVADAKSDQTAPQVLAAHIDKASDVPAPINIKAALLPEDYLTCLAQDNNGRLWIGTRRFGVQVRDARSLNVISTASNESPWHPEDNEGPNDEFVRCILPRSAGGAPLIGGYGQGIAPTRNRLGLQFTPRALAQPIGAARLPAPAGVPTQNELAQLLARLNKVAPLPQSEAPIAIALADDWKTQGDWLGRYGRYQAILAAINSPRDYVWGAGEAKARYDVRIGPHRTPDDSVRYWIQWLSTTSPESLEMPPTYYDSRLKQDWNGEGHRRQAEWDDHGEEYPMTLDGPHVYTSIEVPKGWFVLSLYDFNKDGHIGTNRWRDYRLSMRARPKEYGLETVRGFESWPELASGRIHEFRGGVWKRFLVRGPQALTIEINRNFSFNTVVAGLFLDRLDQQPAPYFGSFEQWQTHHNAEEAQAQTLLTQWNNAPQNSARFVRGKDVAESARLLYQGLQEVRLLNPVWHQSEGRRYYLALLRWCRAQPSNENAAWRRECLTTCYYQLQLYLQWEQEQRDAGLRPARDIEQALRWDGKSNNSGRGNDVVREYLTATTKS